MRSSLVGYVGSFVIRSPTLITLVRTMTGRRSARDFRRPTMNDACGIVRGFNTMLPDPVMIDRGWTIVTGLRDAHDLPLVAALN